MGPFDVIALWPVISGAILLVGGAIAWVYRTRQQHGTDQEQRQTARDVAATTNATQTFRDASELIDQYQQELQDKRAELAEIRTQCKAELDDLRARADAMEQRYLAKIDILERKLEALEKRLREPPVEFSP